MYHSDLIKYVGKTDHPLKKAHGNPILENSARALT